MTHTQTVMLRLLTMCIPFRNLRKKWRTFLRDFLSDYDRDARRSMRAWRRHPVAGRTILILEPNYCHGEVIPGFCRHLLDMGYRVDVLMHHSLTRAIAPVLFQGRRYPYFHGHVHFMEAPGQSASSPGTKPS